MKRLLVTLLLPVAVVFSVPFAAVNGMEQESSLASLSGGNSDSSKQSPDFYLADVNLTGQWRANDNGFYYIRQVGNEIWWYGESSNGGSSWSNVFHGYINGNKIEGSWVDVPKGGIRQNGEIVLEVVSSRRLRAVSRTGGFGGNEWTR